MKNMFDALKRLNKICSKIGLYLAGAGIVITTLLITIEIFCREFLSFSLMVTDEYSSYILVLITFLGLAYTMNEDGFIRIQIVRDRVNETVKNILDILAYAISLIYTIIAFYYSTQFTLKTYNLGLTSPTITKTPLIIPQSFIVIGLFFLIFTLIEGFGDSILRAFYLNKNHKTERGVEL